MLTYIDYAFYHIIIHFIFIIIMFSQRHFHFLSLRETFHYCFHYIFASSLSSHIFIFIIADYYLCFD